MATVGLIGYVDNNRLESKGIDKNTNFHNVVSDII